MIILIALGVIHFNWVFGGKFGFTESLPTKENGERVLNPRKIDSAIVGIGLTAFGVFYALKSGLIDYNIPEWIMTYGSWIIPILFLLRAIGFFAMEIGYIPVFVAFLCALFYTTFLSFFFSKNIGKRPAVEPSVF